MQYLTVGVTGGIGSGKSWVMSIFKTLGYPVYFADAAARQLQLTNPTLRAQMQQHFGLEVFNSDGTVNRAYLGSRVFGDPQQLAVLNSIVHPAVQQDFTEWVAFQIQHASKRLFFKEAAILFESGTDSGLNEIITIYAPKFIRIQRAMKRDQLTLQAVTDRMARQFSDAYKMARADYIIYNDSRSLVIPQVLNIIAELETKLTAAIPANRATK